VQIVSVAVTYLNAASCELRGLDVGGKLSGKRQEMVGNLLIRLLFSFFSIGESLACFPSTACWSSSSFSSSIR
jgi:hypothetical protein